MSKFVLVEVGILVRQTKTILVEVPDGLPNDEYWSSTMLRELVRADPNKETYVTDRQWEYEESFHRTLSVHNEAPAGVYERFTYLDGQVRIPSND